MNEYYYLINKEKIIWNETEKNIFYKNLENIFRTMDEYFEKILENIDVRNEKKFLLINQILEVEWYFFKNSNNIGGEADCQSDYDTFKIMRESQWQTYPDYVLISYLKDVEYYINIKRNIITDKYAYMMKETDYKEFNKIKDQLPTISKEKQFIIENIVGIYLYLSKDVQKKYPYVYSLGRKLESSENTQMHTSVETYLRGELCTYSENTLSMLYYYFVRSFENGENVIENNLLKIVQMYGNETIEELENILKNKEMRENNENINNKI